MGFLVLEALANRENINIDSNKFDSCFGKGVISGVPVVVAKPQTFMNLSGISVGKLARFFKVDTEDVIVIHDDLDLSFTEIRVKAGGGNGGHKGLGSVIDHLGGLEFVRVRLGIGRPARNEMVEGYVLERFSEEEMKILPDIVARASDAVVSAISSGTQAAMNKFNVRLTKNLSKEV
jgi:PTH1 family peptidyl-tRNA hydrolase